MPTSSRKENDTGSLKYITATGTGIYYTDTCLPYNLLVTLIRMGAYHYQHMVTC